MAHDKLYGICENKCMVEVLSKADTETELNRQYAYRRDDTEIGNWYDNQGELDEDYYIYRATFEGRAVLESGDMYKITHSISSNFDRPLRVSISGYGTEGMYVVNEAIVNRLQGTIRFKKPSFVTMTSNTNVLVVIEYRQED